MGGAGEFGRVCVGAGAILLLIAAGLVASPRLTEGGAAGLVLADFDDPPPDPNPASPGDRAQAASPAVRGRKR